MTRLDWDMVCGAEGGDAEEGRAGGMLRFVYADIKVRLPYQRPHIQQSIRHDRRRDL